MEALAPGGRSVLVDGIVAALFLLSAYLKGKKGLYKSLMSLIVALVTLIGAGFLSRLIAPAITTVVYPMVEKSVFAKLDFSRIQISNRLSMADQLESLLPQMLVNLLGKLGVDLNAVLAEAVKGSAAASISDLAATAASGVLYKATAAVVRFVLFCICFIALPIVLNLLKKTMGLAVKLPVIRWVDKLGGAALGFIECAVVLYLVCWMLGLFVPKTIEKLADGTHLLSFFA